MGISSPVTHGYTIEYLPNWVVLLFEFTLIIIAQIVESDVERVDFLLMSQSKWMYITGWVDTDPKFFGTLKVGTSLNSQCRCPYNYISGVHFHRRKE